MSKISKINTFEIFGKFFSDVGHGRIKLSNVAAILILGTSPLPLLAALLIHVMTRFEVGTALDPIAVSYFYQVCFIFSGLCIVVAALGIWVKTHQQFSNLYILILAQVFGAGIYSLCFFLGPFSSPILLTILMSTGVGAVIFDKRQLLYALLSIFILAIITAILQVLGHVKVLPIVKSLALAEIYLIDWYIYVYAIAIPFLSILFSMIVRALMQEYQNKYQELEALAFKLAKYLSPQVYASLFKGASDAHIHTYRKKLTIFFSELNGFTQITENMSSEQLSVLLNRYLNEMSVIALKHGGTIDKYMGESIMIFFGDPDSQGEQDDAKNCILMALEMRSALEKLKQEWQEDGINTASLSIKIGINTGYCTVGNFGSENRIDYTIIGGQVNLASRLQYAATPNAILISHETYGLVNDVVNCIKKEKIHVKGIHRAIQSYEVNDLFENISEEKNFLEEKLNHFLSSLNYKALSDRQKLKVLESIKAYKVKN